MTQTSSSQAPTVLILEDDVETLDEIYEAFSDEGFVTLRAKSAVELRTRMEGNTIDLFLLDLILPDDNGLNLLKAIRQESDVGIIIMSGKTDETDRIVGLEVGADDYVTKPFSPRELLTRARTVLRRTRGETYPRMKHEPTDHNIVQFQDWQLDLGAYHLMAPGGDGVDLTTAEFELLRVFVESPNRVLSRDTLLERVHGREWSIDDRGIDGLVSRLRKKMSPPPGTPPFIKTVRGAGYMFTPKVKKHSR